jgi:ribonuclease HII
LAATDEVGRGPLAGPVVGGAVLVPKLQSCSKKIQDLPGLLSFLQSLSVTDSKKITSLKRQIILENLFGQSFSKIFQELRATPFSGLPLAEVYIAKFGVDLKVAVAEISPQEIDAINILQASLKSMRQALVKAAGITHVENFSELLMAKKRGEGVVLIDGNQKLQFHLPQLEEVCLIKGDQRSLLIGLASIVAKEYRDALMKEYAVLYPDYGLERHAGYPTAKHRAAIKKYGATPIHRLSFSGVILN